MRDCLAATGSLRIAVKYMQPVHDDAMQRGEVAMRLTLNGEAKDFAAGTTVRGLVEALGLGTTRVAVEVNRKIVRRAAWGDVTLVDGDVVEVVHFVGGG